MFNKIINWYFSRLSLPYWLIYIADCLICFLSGLFVFWLFMRGSVLLAHIGEISLTLLTILFVNTIFFRIFHTYSGILRYSSFIDLEKVGYAMGCACVVVFAIHYPFNALGWTQSLGLVRLQGRIILAFYLMATIGMWALRVLTKVVYDTVFSSNYAQRALIYGVQDGGVGIAKNLRNQKPTRFIVKGFVTYDKDYSNRFLLGQRVYTINNELVKVMKEH